MTLTVTLAPEPRVCPILYPNPNPNPNPDPDPNRNPQSNPNQAEKAAAERRKAEAAKLPPRCKVRLVRRLIALLQHAKVRERAVGALGQVGHGEARAIFRNELLQVRVRANPNPSPNPNPNPNPYPNPYKGYCGVGQR